MLCVQLTVSAQDQGVPTSLIASQPATVFINVIRNQFSPVFVSTPYSVDIPQTIGLFARVFTVTASDSDLQVRSGDMGGTDTSSVKAAGWWW